MAVVINSDEFNALYPDWMDCNDNYVFDKLPFDCFIIEELSGGYSALDNRDGCCWAEDFDSIEDAEKWLNDYEDSLCVLFKTFEAPRSVNPKAKRKEDELLILMTENEDVIGRVLSKKED